MDRILEFIQRVYSGDIVAIMIAALIAWTIIAFLSCIGDNGVLDSVNRRKRKVSNKEFISAVISYCTDTDGYFTIGSVILFILILPYFVIMVLFRSVISILLIPLKILAYLACMLINIRLFKVKYSSSDVNKESCNNNEIATQVK